MFNEPRYPVDVSIDFFNANLENESYLFKVKLSRSS